MAKWIELLPLERAREAQSALTSLVHRPLTEFLKAAAHWRRDTNLPNNSRGLGGITMSIDAIKTLSDQFDAALVTLEKLRQMSGCSAFDPREIDTAKRHANARSIAERSIANRRARARHFAEREIFGEPAWDILLDLYVNQADNKQVTVKSACIGSGAPATTALRWLKILEKQGLIVSEDDPTDHRRRLVRLTPEGYESMTRYLNEIA